MKKTLAMSSNPYAFYLGIACLLPAALFFVIGTGMGIVAPHHYPGNFVPMFWLKLGLVALPLLAIVANVSALVAARPKHRQTDSLKFWKSNWLTIAVIVAALGWLGLLYGHDTVGCAVQHLPLLRWQAFQHCAATH